jgi:AcrR family transcriptional regulator
MAVTKDDLTEATLSILEKVGGLEGLTVDALASTLRMSKSTLYKYFDGMDDLIYAAIERLCVETETDLLRIDTTGDVFGEVAVVYGRHAERLPAGLMLSASRNRLPAAARLRLENTEERLNDRMFRAAMGTGASSYVAYGVRSAYEGMIRFLRTVPQEDRHSCVSELTATFRTALKG